MGKLSQWTSRQLGNEPTDGRRIQSLRAYLKFERSSIKFSDAITDYSFPQNNHLWLISKKKNHHLKTKTTKVFIHVLSKKTMANFE